MRIDLGAMLARDNLGKHAGSPLGGLALVLLCVTVYLPGFFSIPPVDRDESRFAQASRQMFESVALPEAERDPELHSGGLAVPMVGGKPRLNKPPLIYWLQAGSAAVLTGGDPLDDAIWMYRVPSLLAGFVIVLATWRIGCSMFDPRVGWVGACLLAVSPVFVWEAHQARADMVMVAWTTLAMGQLWRIWQGSSEGGAFRPPLPPPAGEGWGEGSFSFCFFAALALALGVRRARGAHKGPDHTHGVSARGVVALSVLPRLAVAEGDAAGVGGHDRGGGGGAVGVGGGAAGGVRRVLVDRV